MSLEAKILHTYDFSMGFNYNIVPSIDRIQYITELEELLNDNQVVFLKGEEGSGKTIICQEFVKKFDKITFSVFFNPHNKMDYSVNYFLENIINQVAFKLGESENDELNVDRYRTLLTKLRRSYKGKKIYFVIDGLSDSISLMKEIEELLFLGQTEFRYIITGDDKVFKKEIKNFNKITLLTSIKVVGISINDIKYYLNLSEISKSQEDDIFKITKGLPSRLFLIKRQLEKKISLSKIMESDNYKEWINIELEKIDLSDNFNAKILSLLSMSPNKLTLEDISFIMDINKEEISAIISDIDFIFYDDNNLRFISDSYKISIAEKFKNNLEWVENGLIKLLNKTTDLDKKIELIKLLFDRKRWTDINSEMTDELLINSFRHTGNLNKINSIINIGNNASNQLKLQNNLVHLSLKGSYFNYLQNNLELVSDVTTKLAFKDYDGALNIANKSVINVERLKLYCLIAKKQKLDNNIIEETLLSDIENLFDNSDFSNSGDVIYDIISDLLYIDPTMALKILDNKEIDSSNINDLILAKLSIMSLNNEVDNEKKESANEKLEKFNNVKSRKLNRALSYILGGFSLDKILNEIDKIDDSIEKIKLTRLYLENIKIITEGLEKLIDKTFDILLSSNVNNLINLEILILLSSKITLVKSVEDKKNLLKKLNSIDQLIVDKGLFINKIRYKINIFNIKLSEAPDKSFKILEEIINEIDLEEDLLIKAESLSLVYKSLYNCNSSILKDLKSKNYNFLLKTIDLLIQCTANQQSVFTNVIKHISLVDLNFAVDISKRLNNADSRNFCLLTAIENSIQDVDIKYINIDNIISHLNLFNEKYFKNWAVSLIFEKFSEEESLKNHYLIKIKEIYFSIEKEINSDGALVFLNILLFKIFKKNIQTNRKDFIATKERLKILINTFSQDWTRYEIVNTICAELAEFDIHFTTEIYSHIKNIKDQDVFYSELYCKSYHYNLEYLIFSLDCLIEKKVDTTEYIERIIVAINKIPADIARLDYFSKLGFVFHMHNLNDLSNKLLEKNIYPLLNNDKINLEDTNIVIFIYINNEDFAKRIIGNFSYHYKNDAFYKIALFYLDGNNPYKIYEDKVGISGFTYNNLSKCISVLRNIERDLNIYKIIERISDKMTHRETNLSKTQINYVVSELEIIIDSKLPEQLNVKHQGFKLISTLQLIRIKKDYQKIDGIYQDCLDIPNLSDRIYIKSVILKNLQSSKIAEKKRLFDEIITDLQSLKVTYEYIERINEISEIMYATNNAGWSRIVKSALTISNNLDDKYEVYKYQRNLIDTIHKIDEKLCNELIESVDCVDKIDNKDLVKKHHARLELLKKIKNNQTVEEKEKENQNNMLYAIFNSLMLLNSGKLSPKKIGDINKFLDVSYSIPIDKSIIIYIYYLENISKKVYPKGEEEKIKELLIENLKYTFENFDFLKRLHMYNFKEKGDVAFNVIDESSNLSIEIGERDKAKTFIKDWILNDSENKIVIIDSYFDYEDLELIKLISSINNDVELSILGNKILEKTETLSKWKQMSSENFPISEFIFASKSDSTSPFHDRYIFSLTNKKALRLGTSYNQMGIKKATEISKLEGSDYQHIYDTVVRNFVIERNRIINKERINYDTFQF